MVLVDGGNLTFNVVIPLLDVDVRFRVVCDTRTALSDLYVKLEEMTNSAIPRDKVEAFVQGVPSRVHPYESIHGYVENNGTLVLRSNIKGGGLIRNRPLTSDQVMKHFLKNAKETYHRRVEKKDDDVPNDLPSVFQSFVSTVNDQASQVRAKTINGESFVLTPVFRGTREMIQFDVRICFKWVGSMVFNSFLNC